MVFREGVKRNPLKKLVHIQAVKKIEKKKEQNNETSYWEYECIWRCNKK